MSTEAVSLIAILSVMTLAVALIAAITEGDERRAEWDASRATLAALRPGNLARVVLDDYRPFPARIEIAGQVWGWTTHRAALDWLTIWGADYLDDLHPGAAPDLVGGAVLISHPSTGAA